MFLCCQNVTKQTSLEPPELQYLDKLLYFFDRNVTLNTVQRYHLTLAQWFALHAVLQIVAQK